MNAEHFNFLDDAVVESLFQSGIGEGIEFADIYPIIPFDDKIGGDDAFIDNPVTMSTAFTSDGDHPHGPPDTILISSDHVLFYTHRSLLASACTDDFTPLLLQTTTDLPIFLSETADVVNVLLHVIYETSSVNFSPSVEILLQAIDAMKKYSIPFDRYLTSSSPFFTQVLTQAPLHPMDVYITAAKYGLEDLAVSVSSYLLLYNHRALTDPMLSAMGLIYLNRLVLLIMDRCQTLRELLATTPELHRESLSCGFVQQKMLLNEWKLAICDLIVHATADTSTSLIRSTLEPVKHGAKCTQCRTDLTVALQHIIREWMLTKRTI